MTCECVLSCQLDHKSQQGSISVTIVWRETLDAKQKKAFVLEERVAVAGIAGLRRERTVWESTRWVIDSPFVTFLLPECAPMRSWGLLPVPRVLPSRLHG